MRKQPFGVSLVPALSVLAACGIAFAAQEHESAVRPAIGHAEEVYGRELPIVKDLDIGPTMAARVVGKRLYTIGRGSLRVFDITDPADPKLLGTIGGLGNTRQIAVKDQVAYVASREDGAFIIDVGNPRRPELLSHYDPIEVSTGIDVSGNLMLLPCRVHGLELVDVSDPRRPSHLGTARTGEAQSVEVSGGYAYAGVWGTSELVVVDVRNPREPKITAKCPLDGYGDGVAVSGDYVYAATGHHSRARKKSRPGEGEAGYGCGHGLEIFSIAADPARPEFVSRIKTPPFYRIGNDMWGVKIAGHYAFVHDTHNGLFVVDVRDPKEPRFVAHRQLAYVDTDKPKYMGPEPLTSFVGGLALTDDHIYVAGGWSDLHVVAAPGLAKPCARRADEQITIPTFQSRQDPRFRIYRPDGQVRAVAFLGDTAVVAAGSDGIHLVQLWPEIKLLDRYDTEGLAMEVKTLGKRVYVAEERGGLSIWEQSPEDALVLQGRYQPRGRIVKDVVVPPPGKYAVLQVGMSNIEVVDVSNPARPKSIFREGGHGFVYHLGEDLIDEREICVVWQLGGLRWYDLYGGKVKFTGDDYPHRVGGASVPIGEKRLVLSRSGLKIVARGEQRPPSKLKTHRPGKHRFRGRPTLTGHTLYISNRCFGDINVVDVSDIEKLELLEHFNVPGNPGRLVLRDGALVIPNGYEGLWIERKRNPGK